MLRLLQFNNRVALSPCNRPISNLAVAQDFFICGSALRSLLMVEVVMRN